MKKAICAVALAVALVPAVALGGARSGNGPSTPKLVVHFRVQTLHHRPFAIKRFRFSGLQAHCTHGSITLHSLQKLPGIKVHHRHFRASFRFPHRRRVHVEGKFFHHESKVTGTLNAHGRFGKRGFCRSGPQKWLAS